ncbi:hypothetical protein T484DRAFT_1777818 [Baffinella frigidus]|nr:hypothetical protein T484DRAFT_1777818 [Cryptophyta sp. CCMP2293]
MRLCFRSPAGTTITRMRLCFRSPAGTTIVIPGVRDAVDAEMARRRVLEREQPSLFKLQDFQREPWAAVSHLSKQSGAWAEVACAMHMVLLVEAMGVDKSPDATGGSLTMLFRAMGVDKSPDATGGSLTMLFRDYHVLVVVWFREWDRGGVRPPGGYEASLDGRHAASRPIPLHYTALRNLLMDVAPLASDKARQVAACEALAKMLFSIGEYDESRRILGWKTVMDSEKHGT